MYTPFDRNLDKTFASGVVLEPKYPAMPKPKPSRSSSTTNRYSSSTRRKTTTRRPISKSTKQTPAATEMIQTFAFHRNYVTDLDSLAPGITDQKERTRKIRRELQKIQKQQGTTGALMELRMLTDKKYKMAYVVPPQQEKQKQSFFSVFAKFAALNAVDRLIGMQEIENERIRMQARSGGCCS